MLQSSQNMLNGVNTLGLKTTLNDIKHNPKLARCEFRVRNHWINGDKNESETFDFYAAGTEQEHKQRFCFQAGEPLIMEGQDEGANPVEFLLSALSGCMTTTIAYYAALNGHEIKEMESSYKGDLDLQGLFDLDPSIRPGYQKIYVSFKIKTETPAEELKKYYHFSPVYDVVSKSVPIEVNLETY